jgi:hypothetical protein
MKRARDDGDAATESGWDLGASLVGFAAVFVYSLVIRDRGWLVSLLVSLMWQVAFYVSLVALPRHRARRGVKD